MIRTFTLAFLTILLNFIFLQTFNCFAQVTIDPDFRPTIAMSFGNINALAVQPDGRIIIGGRFQLINNSLYSNIARLNPDGTLDPSFDIGKGVNDVISEIQIQTDGKILVAGRFTDFNNHAATGLVRLNSNGAVDESFTTPASINLNDATKIIIQPDGKILLGGIFSLRDQQRQTSVIRLNTAGSLDPAFASGCSGRYQLGMALQNDGKIILGGSGDLAPLIRLNADGTPDKTFTPNSEEIRIADNIALQDDKIVVTGKSNGATTPLSIGFDKVIRLNNDGSLDNNFLTGMLGSELQDIKTLKILPNKKILVGGYFSYYNNNAANGLVQLNQDGSFDGNFRSAVASGSMISDVRSISNQNDGKILIGGGIFIDGGLITNSLFRLQPDGSLDSSSDPATEFGINGDVNKIAIASDNKVVVCGEFASINGKPKLYIARFLPDGTLDETFKTEHFKFYRIHLLHILPDGDILISGEKRSYSQNPYPPLLRLNPDGSIDPEFHLNIPFNGAITSMTVQPDGKILIIVVTSDSRSNHKLYRLNADGTRDETFQMGVGAPLSDYYLSGGEINSVGLQTDGKIIVVGNFETYNGVVKNRIVRLLPNGILDESFTNPTVFNSIQTVTVQPDNKILLGGDHNSFANYPQERSIIRLQPYGTPDESFTGTTNGGIYAIEVEPSGKIVVGGSFNAANGSLRKNITRFKANGSIDDSFDLGSGVNGVVSTIAYVPQDGTVYFGGSFSHLNNKPQFSFARILPPLPAVPTTLAATLTLPDEVKLTWTDNADNELGYEIQRSITSGSGFVSIDTTASNTTTFTDQGVLTGSTYYYRVRAFNSGGYSVYTPEVKVDINKSGQIVTGTKEPISLDFGLKQNYPNPFNNTTTIQYDLKKQAEVVLEVIDAQGRIVQKLVQQTQKAGTYQVLLDGKSLKNRSVYFIRLQANNYNTVITAIYQ